MTLILASLSGNKLESILQHGVNSLREVHAKPWNSAPSPNLLPPGHRHALGDLQYLTDSFHFKIKNNQTTILLFFVTT